MSDFWNVAFFISYLVNIPLFFCLGRMSRDYDRAVARRTSELRWELDIAHQNIAGAEQYVNDLTEKHRKMLCDAAEEIARLRRENAELRERCGEGA